MEKAIVKELVPLGGATKIILGNEDSFQAPTSRVKKLGVTQGTELKVVESMPNIYYYVGDQILQCCEYI